MEVEGGVKILSGGWLGVGLELELGIVGSLGGVLFEVVLGDCIRVLLFSFELWFLCYGGW